MRALYFLSFVVIMLSLKCSSDENIKSVINKSNKEHVIMKFNSHDINIKFSFNSIDNEISKRKWKTIHSSLLFKLGGIEDTIFKLPITIKTDADQNIYVLDMLDKAVLKFNKTGEFIKKFGRIGKGPGEFLFAQGFDVFDDGKIVVADPNNNKITVFDDGKVIEYKCRLGPLKVSFASSNEVVIFQMLEPIFTSPIRKINFINKTIIDYQNILNRDSFGDKVYGVMPFLIGDVLRYKNNYTVYTLRVLNYVVVFTDKGKIDKAFKMIDDGIDLRQVSIKKFSNKKNYIKTSVDRDDLFICKKINQKKKNKFVIDVFSIPKGKYKYSFPINNFGNIQSIQFVNNRMYIIRENTEINVYNYNIIK